MVNEGIVRFPVAHICFLGGTSGHHSSLVFFGVWGALHYVLVWRLGLTGLEGGSQVGVGAGPDHPFCGSMLHLR